ncbi:MAG: Gfo/Idh/MocA family oxidoreductase [Planctomycetota bacterium]|nr:Gfo/Idh/MocA family oxidoreductase [Planctomycetota bacterium]MDP7133540.1 Gfo/Idh/MocA family oxidoreductase [Planctomycetota bacterium]
MSTKTCLMFGGGGMAGGWLNHWATHFSDRIKVIGLVDVNEEILDQQAEKLGLEKNQLFTSTEDALNSVQADFAGVATPPQFHALQTIAALEAGMAVICEKPIAGTIEDARAMVEAANRTGLPVSIIQNYRYAPDKQEARRIVDEGRFGRLQHVVGRYACDYRKMNSWGPTWRHDMDFALLFEGSIHHMDMLRFLSAGDCETLTGFGWNPEWSSFKHLSSGMYVLKMNNGSHCFYEGNSSSAGIINGWHNEYYRLELEQASVEIAGGKTITVHRKDEEVEQYEAPELKWEGHCHLFDEFLQWLDGGEPSDTRIQENIKSFAMILAAMEAGTEGAVRQIADYL